MRNIFLMLLLANLLYFGWQRWAADTREPGVAYLDVAGIKQAAAAASGGEQSVVDVEQGAELAAASAPDCISIGPFAENDAAEATLSAVKEQAFLAARRSATSETFLGHWVQIKDIKSQRQASQMLAKLKQAGLVDTSLVPTDDEGIKISLGLFSEMEGARKVQMQAKDLDLPADISQRVREDEVFYIDVRLAPGQGGQALMEAYGDDQVLLREAARCPRSG